MTKTIIISAIASLALMSCQQVNEQVQEASIKVLPIKK
jgi:hypothetical protein